MRRCLLWLISGEFKCGAIGLFLVGFGIWELAKQELSIFTWRTTRGTVLESRTEWVEQRRGSIGPQITVRVRYQYVVDGRNYESTRITTGEPILFYGVQEAAAFRQRFRPGDPIQVLYAPYAPSEATLMAERSSGPWILLGFGSPCLFLAIYRWRQRRRRSEPVYPDVEVPVHR